MRLFGRRQSRPEESLQEAIRDFQGGKHQAAERKLRALLTAADERSHPKVLLAAHEALAFLCGTRADARGRSRHLSEALRLAEVCGDVAARDRISKVASPPSPATEVPIPPTWAEADRRAAEASRRAARLSRAREPRVVRVFISSTFRDMHEERDELAKRIFPQLRRLCEERGVVWGEVDLRWGISDEQTAEGKVLPICLAEIERCRPYFIGLLGERYGWVPESIPRELIEREPWLREHLHHSVTELEILHGVLRNPEMADRALFYFRDPVYLDHLPPSADPEDFPSDSEEADRRLCALKDRIRASGLPVRENYTDPQALGQLVLEDLTRIIDQRFPPEEVLDPFEQEAIDHEAFAQRQSRVYVGRQGYFAGLDAHAEGDGPPLVVLGDSGIGKSALLANWALRYQEQHPDTLVLMHFIGTTPFSSDWAAMVRRLIREMQRYLDLERPIPTASEELKGALEDWLHQVAAKGTAIVVLDGLNQLDDRDEAQGLPWLPRVLPPEIRLVASTLPGPSLEAVQHREWQTLTVQPLTPYERTKLLLRHLKQYGKRLSPAQVKRIVQTDQTANPLYLRVLLEELRLFGEHEHLEARLAEYLAAGDGIELYGRVLDRWEEDYERERPGLVGESLSLLWGARRGLSEAELLDLLGTDEGPLPRAHWSPLYLAAEQALAQQSGRLAFFHGFLRQAVEQRWLPDEDTQRCVHRRLAEYFDSEDRGERRLEEMPWQLQEAIEWSKLLACVTDIPTFEALYDRDEYELLGYCLRLPEEYDWGAAYAEAAAEWEGSNEDEQRQTVVVNRLAVFLHTGGQYDTAEPLLRRTLAIRERVLGEEHPDTASTLSSLAGLLYVKGNHEEAELLSRHALAIHEKVFGSEHPDTAASLDTLACLLRAKGDRAGAEPLYRRALAIREKGLGSQHPDTAAVLNNLAGLLVDKGDYEGADQLHRRALAIWETVLGPEHPTTATGVRNVAALLHARGDHARAEPLFRRALAIREKTLGAGHPGTASSLRDLGRSLEVRGEYGEAELLYRQALAIQEKVLGMEHPDTATSHNDLGELLRARGDYQGAEPLYRRALAIREKVLGPGHSDTATVLNNLALLLHARGNYAEAEPLLRRALAISENALGSEHPWTATSLRNLAAVLHATGDYGEAGPLYRRALAIHEKALGPEHPDTATSLNNLAGLLYEQGDYEGAELLFRRALAIREQTLGPEHPDTANGVNNLAGLLADKGDYEGAEPLYRRALAIREQTLGLEHPDTATSLNNLAGLLADKGDYEGAEPLYRRALAIREQALGSEHPDTRTAAEGLEALRSRAP